MKLHRLGLLALFSGLSLSLGMITPSSAGVIGPFGCADSSCMGVEYSLDSLGNQDGNSGSEDIWRIRLTADTTSYTGSADHWISGVAVKLFNGSEITAVSLFSTTALGDWDTAKEGKVNNCGGNENGGVCTEALSQLTVADGSIYEWVFDITTANDSSFIGDPSIQVQFKGINPNNKKIQNQGITSEKISLGPERDEFPPPPVGISEPFPLAAIGMALLSIGVIRRKIR